MDEILELIFLCLGLVVLVSIIILVCVHLFHIFEEPAIQSKMRKLRKSSQPWVTVLVHAYNSEDTIEATLKALLKSHYYNYDIVVVDDCSKDTTSTIIKNFINTHKKNSITLLKRRVKRTSKEALKAGYQKSKRGKVVIVMKAGTLISSSFIKRSVAIKAERQQASVRVNKPISYSSLSDIITSLENIFWHRSQKVLISDAKYIQSITSQPTYSFVGVIALLSIIFASLVFNEAIILWYSWLLVTSYMFAVLWLKDERVGAKFQLTFAAISALFLLPVASLFQGFSQFSKRN